jgi:hypothetical protein
MKEKGHAPSSSPSRKEKKIPPKITQGPFCKSAEAAIPFVHQSSPPRSDGAYPPQIHRISRGKGVTSRRLRLFYLAPPPCAGNDSPHFEAPPPRDSNPRTPPPRPASTHRVRVCSAPFHSLILPWDSVDLSFSGPDSASSDRSARFG